MLWSIENQIKMIPLLALCEGNPPVTRWTWQVTCSIDVFFVAHRNKQWSCRWYDRQCHSLKCKQRCDFSIIYFIYHVCFQLRMPTHSTPWWLRRCVLARSRRHASQCDPRPTWGLSMRILLRYSQSTLNSYFNPLQYSTILHTARWRKGWNIGHA